MKKITASHPWIRAMMFLESMKLNTIVPKGQNMFSMNTHTEKVNIPLKSMQSMTKTTIKVEVTTRKRIRILAARLDVDMDEAINRAAECLEKSLPGEEVK